MTSSGTSSTRQTSAREGLAKFETKKKGLAVKKLMPESFLNCRFRGTTLPCEELLIALENITTDKVTTHSAPR